VSALGEAVAAAAEAVGLPLQAAWVHGSWATRRERRDSDVDVAVLCDRALDWDEVEALAGEIAARLRAGHEVDVADLYGASTVFAAQVIRTGTRLWSYGAAASWFETRALSRYMAFNFARREVLAAIGRRGTVYAAGAPTHA
jgi:predicted nucleotidyltransferase